MKHTVTISEEDRNTYRKSDGLSVPWAWAREQFGDPGSNSLFISPRWNTDGYLIFFFRDDRDAVLFALRWS